MAHSTRQLPDQIARRRALAEAIMRIVHERGLNQEQAAVILGLAPSEVSLIASAKVQAFSLDRLVRSLMRLERDVHIIVRRTTTGRPGRVRLTVH